MVLTLTEIEDILKKNLPSASEKDIQKTALSLIEATGKWKEVDLVETLGAELSVQCRDICVLGNAHHNGKRIRAFITEQ
ncbi:MAG: hypothetical protein WC676_02930 [Candidatus Omnitrophota bacterium]